MRLRIENVAVVFAFLLGGSPVQAQSFEKSLETVGATLRPRFQEFQASMREPRVAAAVASERTDNGGPAVGERVVDSHFGAGTVREAFTNGTVKVDFDTWGGYKYRDIGSLGKGVRCHNGLCQNNRVVDPYYGAGNAEEVFTNGTAKVNFDTWGGRKYRNIGSLGVGVDCYDGLCVNNRVVDSYFGAGNVEEVFTNGTAKVNFDNWGGYKYRNIGSLGAGRKSP